MRGKNDTEDQEREHKSRTRRSKEGQRQRSKRQAAVQVARWDSAQEATTNTVMIEHKR